MSGCLICQRPDICSTTSLESIRTSTLAVGSRSRAACRPATRPPYSATLLVARPTDSARSARTRPVWASRTSAPYPAGPGLPRDPPSASTMSRRLTPRLRGQKWPFLPSQAGLGGADQDPAAVLAAQHAVRIGVAEGGQLVAVELDPAPLAAAGVQLGGAGGPGLLGDPVVQGQQRRRDGAGDLVAPGLVLLGRVDDVGQRRVALLLGPLLLRLRPGQPRLRGGQRGVGGLPALHQLEHLVLQVGLPPVQRLQLVLQAGDLLGRRPGVDPRLVPRRPLADGLDVGLQPLLLAVEVTDLGLGPDDVVGEGPLRLLGRLDGGELGEGAPAVSELREGDVLGSEGQQLLLVEVVSLHAVNLPAGRSAPENAPGPARWRADRARGCSPVSDATTAPRPAASRPAVRRTAGRAGRGRSGPPARRCSRCPPSRRRRRPPSWRAGRR